MTKYLSFIFLLLVAVSGIRAQCSNNIPCTPQITGESPSGYTNCPTNQSKICNGVTYNGNVNGTSVHMDLSSYYISGNNTYLTFTAKKCTVPFGASNNFSGANMTFKIVDAGSCVSIGSQTVSSSGSTVSVQVSLSNFNATKSFSGLLTSGSLNFYLGDIIVTSATYLDQVCISYSGAPNPSEINLNWPNVSGSTEYTLQYRIGSGSWTPSTPLFVNSSDYTKLDCSPSTTYEFRIKAFNSNENIQSCDFGYTTVTTPAQALQAPTNFTVSNNGANSLIVNWSTVPNATGYEIQRDGPVLNGWTTVAVISSGSQSMWTDGGLLNNSSYHYRMRATNSAGVSGYTATVSGLTSNLLPAPQLTSVTPNGTTMNLTWISGGGSIQYYTIYRKVSGGTYSQIGITCCATPTTYSDVNLSAGTYFYKIKAVDPNGTQGYESNELSNTINGTSGITSCTVSPNPVAIGGSLTINWSMPNNGGSNVKIELLSTSGATLLTLYSSTPNDGSEVWTVNNISAGIYQVKVSSISMPSNFATSSNLTISANQSQNITISVPNTTGLSYAAGGSIPITWSAVGVSGNYKVELITTSGSQGTILSSNTTSPFSWSIPPTQVQGSNYKIRVTSLQTPSVFDESDNAFTITNSSSASCSCNTMTNPPSTSVEEFAAATYLCQKCIIDNPANGNVNPTAPVIKQDLAKMLYKALLGGNTLPAQYSFITDVIEKYPNPYPDMNGNSEYQRYGRVLLYLDYSNGVSPFTRRNSFYNPTGRVSRAQVCKAIVETFNIPIPGILTEPFTDVTPGTEEYKYICACYAKGIITGTTNSAFNPTASATRIQAMLMIYRYLNGNGSSYPPNIPPIVSISDFAMPDNYTPEIAGNELGLTDAMFNEYSQASFSIPDKQMAIGFSHSYNSALSFLPAEYYGYNYISNITNGDTVWAFRDMRPLGVGWNHNYNAYIKKIDGYNNGSNGASDDILVVVWPDGTMNYYQDNAALTKLTLGNFDQIVYNSSTGTYIITKKDQVKYTFKQTANTNSKSPFMLTRIEDRNGNAIALDYLVATGGAPRLNKVIAPSGRYLSFEYADNQTPKIKTVKDPLNRQVSFSYSIAEGLLGQYTDADNFNTTYNYLEIAPAPENWYLLSKVKRPEGNEITNTYDARRKLQSSTVVNSNGVTYSRTITNFGYSGPNPTNGTSGSVITNDGANTLATSFAKNTKGDISTITTPTLPTGASILYNDPMYPTLPTQITANTVTTKYEYSQDNKGNVTKVIQDQGGLNLTHTVTYTALNDVATYQNPRLKTTTFVYGDGINLTAIQRPIGTTGITYLSGGLVDIVTNPEGIQTRFEYNGYGNVTKTTISGSGLSISTRAEYDAASRMIKSWDANDKLTQFEYNARDLPTKETNPLNYNTQFGYDKNGNLKQIINARGYVTELAYDNLDQVVSESFGNSVKQYEYWNDGKLKKITKPDGVQLNYNYSTDGLLQTDGYATFGYDGRKRLQTVSKDGNSIGYNYDNIDRISSITYDGQAVAYTYDANSNVKTLTYPGNKIVTYGYDDNDRLLSVQDWNSQTTNYTYKLDDRLNTIAYPNGVVTTHTYDGIGRTIGINTQKSGSPAIYTHTFINDGNGNHVLETRQDPINTYPSAPASAVNYTYTGTNRIQNAGNTQFTFDANGNTQAKSGSSYTWDSHDMLTGVSSSGFNATYTYDGLGHRRKAVRNGTTTKYVLDILGMSQILMETTDAGAPINYYVYGNGLISRIKPDNSTRYYHGDFRGSTIAMTDANAAITHKYQYDEFGAVRQKVEQDENRFRFVGLHGVMYEDSLLCFMRARYYDAEIGRFLSEDPIWSVNLYAYAGNNPLGYIDIMGFKEEKVNNKAFAAATWRDIIAGTLYSLILYTTPKLLVDKIELSENSWNAIKNSPAAKYIDKKSGESISFDYEAIEGNDEIKYKRIVESKTPFFIPILGRFTIFYDKDKKPIGMMDDHNFDIKITEGFSDRNILCMGVQILSAVKFASNPIIYQPNSKPITYGKFIK